MSTLHALMKKLIAANNPRVVKPLPPRPALDAVEARHVQLHAQRKTKSCCF